MKKIWSALLSAALLSASLSPVALAAETGVLPVLELNTPQSFTFQPTTMDEDAQAVFIPSESGWYEFVCDTPYTGTPSVTTPTDADGSNDGPSLATWTACLENVEEGSTWPFTFGFDPSPLPEDALKSILELMPHPTEIAFAAELEKGSTYVFHFAHDSTTAFTTNLTVSPHEHLYDGETETRKSEVDDSGSVNLGGVFRTCSVWYCRNEEVVKAYPMVYDCTLAKEKLVYTGKELKPAVTVLTGDEKKLNSKYYTVSYKNNKKVGKATVTLTFRDRYTGKMKRSFKIVPAGTAFTKSKAKKKAVALSWKKQSSQTDGYQIQYGRKVSFEDAKTLTVKGNKTTSKTIKNLKSGKKYYFRVRTFKTVDGKNYCSAWSAKKSVRAK